MKKIISTSLISLFALALFSAPLSVVLAQGAPRLDYSGFVKCDGVVKPGEPYRTNPCDFYDLILTFEKAINWLFYISIPVVTVLFAYAGLLYMTGTPGKITEAKKVFTTVGIGFIIMITAWLGVRIFVDWFVAEPAAKVFIGK